MIVGDTYAALAGQKLRKLRKKAGYTAGEFARLSKCKSEQQLYRYERGVNKIDLDVLISSLKVLDVDISLFFDELVSETNNEVTDNYIAL